MSVVYLGSFRSFAASIVSDFNFSAGGGFGRKYFFVLGSLFDNFILIEGWCVFLFPLQFHSIFLLQSDGVQVTPSSSYPFPSFGSLCWNARIVRLAFSLSRITLCFPLFSWRGFSHLQSFFRISGRRCLYFFLSDGCVGGR